LRIAAVTSTIGRPVLKQTIESVAAQTVPVTHYVFAHGEQYWEATRKALEGSNAVGVYLPHNNGDRGYGMAPVYAAAPYIVNEDLILYVDDDNFFEPTHAETLSSLVERKSLDFAYSLRRIVADDGSYICDDDCESLGYFPNFSGHYVVDNSCFAVRTEVARLYGWGWYHPCTSDRHFLETLLNNKCLAGCTGKATVNYRLSTDGSQSMPAENFYFNNKEMKERYEDQLPWRHESIIYHKEKL